MTTYRIKDWEQNFENNRTRDMVKMAWVPVPNKHDGEGFRRIMREKDGISIYGCWHLILQVASKCLRERGTLMRDDGTPLDAIAISLKTGWNNEKDIQRALDFCSLPEIAWIEVLGEDGKQIPQVGAGIPQAPARKGREGKGIEKKSLMSDFEEAWKAYPDKGGSKQTSLQAYLKHRKSGDTQESILAGIKRYKAYVAGKRSSGNDLHWRNGQTFFNQANWRDEWETEQQGPVSDSKQPAHVKARVYA